KVYATIFLIQLHSFILASWEQVYWTAPPALRFNVDILPATASAATTPHIVVAATAVSSVHMKSASLVYGTFANQDTNVPLKSLQQTIQILMFLASVHISQQHNVLAPKNK
ncbi:unnamed protein product, partial [Ixodes persulcatus]